MRVTFRHFSTFFLIVAVVTVSVQLVYAFVFQDVLSVTDLHAQIETFPETRLVRNVGAADLKTARTAAFGVLILQLLSLPILLKATARVLEVDADNGVPTVADAYRSIARRWPRFPIPGGIGIGPLIVSIVFGTLVAWLVYRIGIAAAAIAPSGATFVVIGLVRGVAPAVAAPFALVTGAYLIAKAKAQEGDRPKLY